ncbi:DMT family transporter [Mycobacterium sp. 050128]|uniref:DMT family transporter n=1 Tax=Mycobacterium sp. 050128 TaxID=3096112 RepID=UPI003FA52B94
MWANALGQTGGFNHLAPKAMLVVTFAASVYGLAVTLRQNPLSTGYAIWTVPGRHSRLVTSPCSG